MQTIKYYNDNLVTIPFPMERQLGFFQPASHLAL